MRLLLSEPPSANALTLMTRAPRGAARVVVLADERVPARLRLPGGELVRAEPLRPRGRLGRAETAPPVYPFGVKDLVGAERMPRHPAGRWRPSRCRCICHSRRHVDSFLPSSRWWPCGEALSIEREQPFRVDPGRDPGRRGGRRRRASLRARSSAGDAQGQPWGQASCTSRATWCWPGWPTPGRPASGPGMPSPVSRATRQWCTSSFSSPAVSWAGPGCGVMIGSSTLGTESFDQSCNRSSIMITIVSSAGLAESSTPDAQAAKRKELSC